MCGWDGVGGVELFGDHILQEFNTLFLITFRTYKIDTPPQTKTYEGRGLQTDKHLPQSLFTGQCFYITTFDIAFYQSNLSTFGYQNPSPSYKIEHIRTE